MEIKFNRKYKNLENQKIYFVYEDTIINTTNKRNGTHMVLYTDGILLFVRDVKEFLEKFKLVE